MTAEIIKFPMAGSLVDDLEELLKLAKAGEIIGLVGYMVCGNGDVQNITSDHRAVDNGAIAYCTILLGRTVADDYDNEILAY